MVIFLIFLFTLVCFQETLKNFLKCHKIVSDFHNLVKNNLKNSITRGQNSDINYLKTKGKDALNIIIFCGERQWTSHKNAGRKKIPT